MNIPTVNIAAILPAGVLSITGVIVMIAGPFVSAAKKGQLGWLALIGVLLATVSLAPM